MLDEDIFEGGELLAGPDAAAGVAGAGEHHELDVAGLDGFFEGLEIKAEPVLVCLERELYGNSFTVLDMQDEPVVSWARDQHTVSHFRCRLQHRVEHRQHAVPVQSCRFVHNSRTGVSGIDPVPDGSPGTLMSKGISEMRLRVQLNRFGEDSWGELELHIGMGDNNRMGEVCVGLL